MKKNLSIYILVFVLFLASTTAAFAIKQPPGLASVLAAGDEPPSLNLNFSGDSNPELEVEGGENQPEVNSPQDPEPAPSLNLDLGGDPDPETETNTTTTNDPGPTNNTTYTSNPGGSGIPGSADSSSSGSPSLPSFPSNPNFDGGFEYPDAVPVPQTGAPFVPEQVTPEETPAVGPGLGVLLGGSSLLSYGYFTWRRRND